MDDWLRVRVARAGLVAEGVREFVLQPLDGGRLRAWRAGAHLRLRAKTADGRAVERRYSLVGSVGSTEACVIAVHRAHDHGVSAYLHDRIQVGDTLDVSQPTNDFAMHEAPQRTLLIAGGIGITPLLPMARELAAARREFELHYAARSGAAMAYRAEAEALAAGAVHLYLGDAGRRLEVGQLARHWHGDDHVYVCGPSRMIDEVRDVAARAALPPQQVHFESFGHTATMGDRGFTVDLRRSRRVLEVTADQSVLQAMEQAGLYVESDCLRGECGVCAVRAVEGEVDHRDSCLSDADRRTVRLMAPCVSRAAGERLVLEL